MAVRSQLGSQLAPRCTRPWSLRASAPGQPGPGPGRCGRWCGCLPGRGPADLRARSGRPLRAGRPQAVTEPSTARPALPSGRVDSRLLMTLSALAPRSAVRYPALSDAGPGVGASLPLRQLTVASPSAAYLRQLLSSSCAPSGPLCSRSSPSVVMAPMTDGRIKFTAPSPTGLLGGAAPPCDAPARLDAHWPIPALKWTPDEISISP